MPAPSGSKPVVYPDITYSSGTWSAVSGDFDADLVIQNYSGVTGVGMAAEGTLEIGFGTYTMNLNERCAGVRLYVFDKQAFNSTVSYQHGISGTFVTADNQNNQTDVDWQWRTTSLVTTINAHEWLQADIDDLRFRAVHTAGNNAGSTRTLDTVQYELDIRQRPVVTTTGPAEGSINISTAPTITWSFLGNNGQAQTRYRVRIFSNAQYTAGGFDPAVTAATYDSGWVISAINAHTVPSGYLTGSVQYRAYVTASKDFNGANWDSAYDANTFTTVAVPGVTVDAPAEAEVLSATTLPLVEWTYASANPQARFHVKIYSSAEYGAFGFDPNSSTATYDSLEQVGLADEWQTTTTLQDGTYRAYVYAAYQVGADFIWSFWDYNTFSVSADRPSTPDTPLVTEDSDNARLQITLQGHDNLLSENDADLETSVGDWQGFGATVARSTAKFKHGAASLEITATGTTGAASRNTISVVAGTPYAFSAWFAANTTLRNVSLSIDWYQSDLVTYISTSTGSTVAEIGTNFSPGIMASLLATAPALAAYAVLQLNILTTTAVGEKHYVDQLYFGPGTSTTWSKGGYSATAVFVVEYSDDGGTTWEIHPDMNRVAPISSQAQYLILSDYRALQDVARRYRVYVSAEPSTTEIVSATSAASTDYTLTLLEWWLIDIEDETLNMEIYPMGDTMSISSHEQMAVYRPLGRSRAVVVTDVIQGDEFSLDLEFSSTADWEEFEAIRAARRILLLRSPWLDRDWWIKIGRQVDTKIHNSDPPYRLVSVPFIEVDEVE